MHATRKKMATEDEAEALLAIYGEDFREINRGYEIKLESHHDRALKLAAILPGDYPASPPHVSICALKNISERQRLALTEAACDEAVRNQGEVSIFEIVTTVKACLDNLEEEKDEPRPKSESAWTFVPAHPGFGQRSIRFDAESANDVNAVNIVDCDSLTDRKSTFAAVLCTGISCEAQLRWALRRLLERPKIAKATHNMRAHRFLEGDVVKADNDDDGEDGAGSKIAHLLDLFKTTDVLVVVSRWYGGIKLGPDRFKHIAKLTQRALETHGYVRGGAS